MARCARGPDLPPRIRPVEPEQNTKRTVTLRDPRVSVPSFQKQWVVPSYHTAKQGEAEALDLLAEILGGGNRSRLYQQLVVKKASPRGPAPSSRAPCSTTPTSPSMARRAATPGIDQVEGAIDAEIARIIKDGVTAGELEKAKNRYVRSMIFARDKQVGMANIYGSTLATGGNVQDVAEWPDRIRRSPPTRSRRSPPNISTRTIRSPAICCRQRRSRIEIGMHTMMMHAFPPDPACAASSPPRFSRSSS